MPNVQKQMRPYLKEANAQDNWYVFETDPMFDVYYNKWTYKRWSIDWDDQFEMGAYRMIGSWIDCKEDGTFIQTGELYEPMHFDSLEDAIENITIEVESYI